MEKRVGSGGSPKGEPEKNHVLTRFKKERRERTGGEKTVIYLKDRHPRKEEKKLGSSKRLPTPGHQNSTNPIREEGSNVK